MSEYISIKKLKKKKVYSFQTVFGAFPKNEWFYKYDDIHSIPSADVRENIHGHWEEDGHGHIICSACKEANVSTWKSRYCPLCGAIMDGESKVTAKVEIDGEPISKTIADMREPIGEKGK